MKNTAVLPAIHIIGGATKEIRARLKSSGTDKHPFDARTCIVNFSIINSNNITGHAVLSKQCDIQTDDNGVASIISINLLALDTLTLHGKYIYQISIVDVDGTTEIPKRGYMFIDNNINQEFIRDNV